MGKGVSNFPSIFNQATIAEYLSHDIIFFHHNHTLRLAMPAMQLLRRGAVFRAPPSPAMLSGLGRGPRGSWNPCDWQKNTWMWVKTLYPQWTSRLMVIPYTTWLVGFDHPHLGWSTLAVLRFKSQPCDLAMQVRDWGRGVIECGDDAVWKSLAICGARKFSDHLYLKWSGQNGHGVFVSNHE